MPLNGTPVLGEAKEKVAGDAEEKRRIIRHGGAK
jgi:hypothetical protein